MNKSIQGSFKYKNYAPTVGSTWQMAVGNGKGTSANQLVTLYLYFLSFPIQDKPSFALCFASLTLLCTEFAFNLQQEVVMMLPKFMMGSALRFLLVLWHFLWELSLWSN